MLQQAAQAQAASLPAATPLEKHHSLIHTPSMPFANYQLNQERHLRLVQSQLDGHKLRADEFERLSERLAADLETVKERHSAAGHRQFQVLHTHLWPSRREVPSPFCCQCEGPLCKRCFEVDAYQYFREPCGASQHCELTTQCSACGDSSTSLQGCLPSKHSVDSMQMTAEMSKVMV